MRFISSTRAVSALALLVALAIPASAAAVPNVTSVVGNPGDPGVVFPTVLTTTQVQYVVSVDGYAVGYGETNGVTRDGVLDYSVLPAAYRAPATAQDKLTFPAAQTGVQAHATCSNVPALSDAANILAWQRNAGNDPYYAYIPWQSASAGLGDDPTRWIPVVRTATGVDLSRLATAADARTACERLGGTYVAADTSSAIATALIANATAPLQRQIATLTRDNATLTRARATADRAAATARAAQRLAEETYQSFFTRPIALTLAAKRFAPNGVVGMITGAPTDPVDVTLELARKKARKLGLPRVLAETLGEINQEGATLITLKPDADVLAKIAKRPGLLAVTVHAVSGGNEDSARAKLVVPADARAKAKKAKKKGAAK